MSTMSLKHKLHVLIDAAAYHIKLCDKMCGTSLHYIKLHYTTLRFDTSLSPVR